MKQQRSGPLPSASIEGDYGARIAAHGLIERKFWQAPTIILSCLVLAGSCASHSVRWEGDSCAWRPTGVRVNMDSTITVTDSAQTCPRSR
jgi:hypothetical protein